MWNTKWITVFPEFHTWILHLVFGKRGGLGLWDVQIKVRMQKAGPKWQWHVMLKLGVFIIRHLFSLAGCHCSCVLLLPLASATICHWWFGHFKYYHLTIFYCILFPGVLPCAPPPGAAHDQCNAASRLHAQCDHRAKETGCGPGWGGHQMGVAEDQRPAGVFMYCNKYTLTITAAKRLSGLHTKTVLCPCKAPSYYILHFAQDFILNIANRSLPSPTEEKDVIIEIITFR